MPDREDSLIRRPRPFASVQEATAYLQQVAKAEDVLHLSYWYLQYSGDSPDQVIWVATYDPQYMSFYMGRFTPMDDPVINSVMKNKFVDWAEWFTVDHLAQEVHSLAAKYGLTKYGISMPLVAPGEDKIIFSVCTASNDADWPQQRSSLVQRFLPFAGTFDNLMRPLVNAADHGESIFKLSA